jgi:nucleoside-diphosphate-sugar epimerase
VPNILIAGCGFLGEAAAVLFLEAGWSIVAVTATPESATRLRKVASASSRWNTALSIHTADLANSASIQALRSHVGPVDAVIHCASSGRGGAGAYRAVYLDGMRHLLDAFPDAATHLFTSSTSVYAQTDGILVDETSPSNPDRETSRILLETERLALDADGFVARLSGIYGPGRSVYLRKILAGEAVLEAGGARWINQIHRDDAAHAFFHLITTPHTRGIYNVTDNTPATQRDLYGWLSEFFNKPLPPDGPADLTRKRGWTSKRVSNAKLRATGWTPRFASYRDAIPTLAATMAG